MIFLIIFINIAIIFYTKRNYERNIISKLYYSKISFILFLLSYMETFYIYHNQATNIIYLIIVFLTVPFGFKYFEDNYLKELEYSYNK